jgi:hypothetical protein
MKARAADRLTVEAIASPEHRGRDQALETGLDERIGGGPEYGLVSLTPLRLWKSGRLGHTLLRLLQLADLGTDAGCLAWLATSSPSVVIFMPACRADGNAAAALVCTSPAAGQTLQTIVSSLRIAGVFADGRGHRIVSRADEIVSMGVHRRQGWCV